MNLVKRAANRYDLTLRNTKEALAGYEQLRQLYIEKQAECSAALKDWNADRSPEMLDKLQVSRSNLATVKELMEADMHSVAVIEAALEHDKATLFEAQIVEQTVGLAAALSRQQEFYREDFNTLQTLMVETISKLDQTRKGWESMHAKAHTLAREAGVPLSRILKVMEAEGYDSNPLRLVLASNNVMGLDAATQRQFEFPSAVDGSDTAQQVRGTLMQFINRSAEERLRAKAQHDIAEADRKRAAARQRIEAEQEAVNQKLREDRQRANLAKQGRKARSKAQDRAALAERTKATASTVTYTPAEDSEEE